ncbi:MAG: succinylglutamate desuccinylase/aspartoacylase family protein [Candidatus Nanohaloarchaea archaeon]
MRCEDVGEGEPEVAVVGSLHGDEPAGKKAIERFLMDDHEVKKPVRLVIGNEKALHEGERYLEADLNRSFPGDPESDVREERLAAKILDRVRGMKVLDIHSTHSKPVPYGLAGDAEAETLEIVESAGVENFCYFREESGSLNEKVDGAVVEVGEQGTEEAAEMAYEILLNFLAEQGVIEADSDSSSPEVYRYSETVRGGDWEFLAENFSRVEEGEVFARSGSTELVTTETFYPVLMSTDGYSDILGHKAEKVDVRETS